MFKKLDLSILFLQLNEKEFFIIYQELRQLDYYYIKQLFGKEQIIMYIIFDASFFLGMFILELLLQLEKQIRIILEFLKYVNFYFQIIMKFLEFTIMSLYELKTVNLKQKVMEIMLNFKNFFFQIILLSF